MLAFPRCRLSHSPAESKLLKIANYDNLFVIELKGTKMSALKLMGLVFGVVLVMSTMNCAFAEVDKHTSEQEKKATQPEEKAMTVAPRPEKSKGMAAKHDRLDKRVDALFQRVDADKDGKVSHDEYMMPDELFFKNSDSNHDGFLTKEELQDAWRKRMRNKQYRMMREQLKEKQPSK